MPLAYHAGQRAVQDEASTRMVADKLATWVGPVYEHAQVADLIVLAIGSPPRFTLISGAAPLCDVSDPTALGLPALPAPAAEALCGGLAIHLGQARRVRVNGTLRARGAFAELTLAEPFTLCRKYMAPSVVIERGPHVGPTSRTPIALGDARDLLAQAEVAFLGTIAPSGLPDVSHRGGPPGFLALADDTITWPEYVGDGIFKSAGNLRANGVMTLLVPDLATGDAIELTGHAAYVNERSERKGQRQNALVQHKEPFPLQGRVTATIATAHRLAGAILPRRAVEKAKRVTSCEAPEEQAPR